MLHARCKGWVGNLGLAALSVCCFTFVVMAWYGVNILGGGLQDYGFNSNTGAIYVSGAIAAQLCYVLAIAAATFCRRPPARSTAPSAPAQATA